MPDLSIAYAAQHAAEARLAAYAAANLAASTRAVASAGWDLLPVLPLVFLAFHTSYGLGFAMGMIDFVLLRRGGRQTMTGLTRG